MSRSTRLFGGLFGTPALFQGSRAGSRLPIRGFPQNNHRSGLCSGRRNPKFPRAKAKVLTRYALGHWDVALALAWGPPAGRKTEINNFPRKGHHSRRRLGWMAKFSKSEERENLATSALGHWKAPLTLPTLPEDRGRVGAPQATFLEKDHRLEAQLGLNGQNFVKRRKGNLAKSTLGHWRPR